MTNKELINKIPTHWSQVTLNKYIELVSDLPSEKEAGETDNRFMARILAVFIFHFTGTHLHNLQLSATETMELVNRVNQFNEDPDLNNDLNKTHLIKEIEAIDYETFITMVKLLEMNTMNVYSSVINLMLVKPINDLGDSLNMAEAYMIIQDVKKKLTQYLECSQRSLKEKILLSKEKEQ